MLNYILIFPVLLSLLIVSINVSQLAEKILFDLKKDVDKSLDIWYK